MDMIDADSSFTLIEMPNLTAGSRRYTSDHPRIHHRMTCISTERFYSGLYVENEYFTIDSIRILSDAIRRASGDTIRCRPGAADMFTMFWMPDAPIQFQLADNNRSVDVYIPDDGTDTIPFADRLYETLNFLSTVKEIMYG